MAVMEPRVECPQRHARQYPATLQKRTYSWFDPHTRVNAGSRVPGSGVTYEEPTSKGLSRNDRSVCSIFQKIVFHVRAVSVWLRPGAQERTVAYVPGSG